VVDSVDSGLHSKCNPVRQEDGGGGSQPAARLMHPCVSPSKRDIYFPALSSDPHLWSPSGPLRLLQDELSRLGWHLSAYPGRFFGRGVTVVLENNSDTNAEFASSYDLALACAALKALGVVNKYRENSLSPPAISESRP